MRVRAIGVAVALLLTGTGAASARAALPSDSIGSAGPNLIEFNLAGWRQNKGGLAPADRVVSSVAAATARPVAVALSEVCSSNDPTRPGQFEHLRVQLARLGYTSFFAAARTQRVGARCDTFGNAIAFLGAAVPVTHAFATQAPGHPARRNIVCAVGVTTIGDLAACSTHLWPNESTDHVTEDQAAEAFTWVQATFPMAARLVGGDFNLRPPDPALDDWYTSFVEGDASNRVDPQPTRDSGIKNDFVFADRTAFTAASTAAITAVPESDHHVYEARFTLAS